MYYIGFLKHDPKHTVLFKSIKRPTKSSFEYFIKVMGPYKSWNSARAMVDKLKKEYGVKENPSRESRAQYCRERQMSPSAFAAGSFRTIRLGKKKKGVVACPKGHYHRGQCGVGTKLQTILHPVGTTGCPVGGLELKKRKRNPMKTYMTDKQALTLTRKVVAFGKRLMKHEQSEIRRGRKRNPSEGHIGKFLGRMKELERFAVGSKEYIDKLATAYGHLKAAKEVMTKK